MMDSQMNNHMGKKGNDTGLVDKNGVKILIGSRMRFDEKEWGSSENEFVVGLERGVLLIKGSIGDLSEFCEVIED